MANQEYKKISRVHPISSYRNAQQQLISMSVRIFVGPIKRVGKFQLKPTDTTAINRSIESHPGHSPMKSSPNQAAQFESDRLSCWTTTIEGALINPIRRLQSNQNEPASCGRLSTLSALMPAGSESVPAIASCLISRDLR